MFEIASKVQRRQTTTKCFLALNFCHIAYILHFQVAPLDQYFFLLCFVCKPKRAYENIARIAKAAQHKLPGKSSLNVSFVCPVCPVMNHSVTKVGIVYIK